MASVCFYPIRFRTFPARTTKTPVLPSLSPLFCEGGGGRRFFKGEAPRQAFRKNKKRRRSDERRNETGRETKRRTDGLQGHRRRNGTGFEEGFGGFVLVNLKPAQPFDFQQLIYSLTLSLIHISEPTRQAEISY